MLVYYCYEPKVPNTNEKTETHAQTQAMIGGVASDGPTAVGMLFARPYHAIIYE